MLTQPGRLVVVALGAAFVAQALLACAGHQPLSPVPLEPRSAAHSLTNPLNSFRSSDDEVFGPLTNVTVSIVVTVPSGSAAQSISVSVDGGAPVIADITSGSPGCSGTPLVCTISVTAPTARDVFAFKTYSGTGGTGSVIAMGNVLQLITTTNSTVDITLAGTPAAIVLALKTVSPRECNPATNIPLYVMVMDSSANTIIGDYGEIVTLSDSDTSGNTTLSAASL